VTGLRTDEANSSVVKKAGMCLEHSTRKNAVARKTAIAAQRTAPLPLRTLFAGSEVFSVENHVVTDSLRFK
jgi:hypothetical protein